MHECCVVECVEGGEGIGEKGRAGRSWASPHKWSLQVSGGGDQAVSEKASRRPESGMHVAGKDNMHWPAGHHDALQ